MSALHQVAPGLHPVADPSGNGQWVPYDDPTSGRTYWVNHDLKQTQWDPPMNPSAPPCPVALDPSVAQGTPIAQGGVVGYSQPPQPQPLISPEMAAAAKTAEKAANVAAAAATVAAKGLFAGAKVVASAAKESAAQYQAAQAAKQQSAAGPPQSGSNIPPGCFKVGVPTGVEPGQVLQVQVPPGFPQSGMMSRFQVPAAIPEDRIIFVPLPVAAPVAQGPPPAYNVNLYDVTKTVLYGVGTAVSVTAKVAAGALDKWANSSSGSAAPQGRPGYYTQQQVLQQQQQAQYQQKNV